MNDKQAFEAEEAIGRGDPCPSCFAYWIKAPEGAGYHAQLTHNEGCEFWAYRQKEGR